MNLSIFKSSLPTRALIFSSFLTVWFGVVAFLYEDISSKEVEITTTLMTNMGAAVHHSMELRNKFHRIRSIEKDLYSKLSSKVKVGATVAELRSSMSDFSEGVRSVKAKLPADNAFLHNGLAEVASSFARYEATVNSLIPDVVASRLPELLDPQVLQASVKAAAILSVLDDISSLSSQSIKNYNASVQELRDQRKIYGYISYMAFTLFLALNFFFFFRPSLLHRELQLSSNGRRATDEPLTTIQQLNEVLSAIEPQEGKVTMLVLKM